MSYFSSMICDLISCSSLPVTTPSIVLRYIGSVITMALPHHHPKSLIIMRFHIISSAYPIRDSRWILTVHADMHTRNKQMGWFKSHLDAYIPKHFSDSISKVNAQKRKILCILIFPYASHIHHLSPHCIDSIDLHMKIVHRCTMLHKSVLHIELYYAGSDD